MTAPLSAQPLPWTHCAHNAHDADHVGCTGIRVPGKELCLPHLDSDSQAAFLASLAPGDDIDLRGTALGGRLLTAVLTAMTDPASGHPRLGGANFAHTAFTGPARFEWATFTGPARFESATFTSDAWFYSATFVKYADFSSVTFTDGVDFRAVTFTGGARFRSAAFSGIASFGDVTFSLDSRAEFESATFTGPARFESARFKGGAWFDSAIFTRDASFFLATFSSLYGAWFRSATFTGNATFESATFDTLYSGTEFSSATFSGLANFESATFSARASFKSVTFTGAARFVSATFTRGVWFDAATFEGLQHIGRLICHRELVFNTARFTGPHATIEAAAAEVSCQKTTFLGPAFLRLRHAGVSLNGALLGASTALYTQPVGFSTANSALEEDAFPTARSDARVRLTDLEGVDAGNLVLTDIDLSQCRFTGAFHLDQIQIGFGCAFAEVPSGWRRRGKVLPLRWSRRKTVAEEHHWRALEAGAARQGWTPSPVSATEHTPGPDDLTGVYQQLRKSFEDAGNEPDAADFYYGEMEMRRNDPTRTHAERALLWLYWLVSGYGLRASRALGWLATAMAATVLVLLLIGLPDAGPVPQTAGTVSAGRVQLITDTPDPTLSLPVGQRFTMSRAQKATLIVVNSVVFRSSGQNLTLPGTVVEMLSRIGEPILLGLAALAVRGRVKR